MVTANEIADFFISRSDPEAGDVMTQLKIQKLLYYAQGWHLAAVDRPLFAEEVRALPHGPVVMEVLERFKGRQWNPIMPNEVDTDPELLEENPGVDFALLEEIWDEYGQYSAKWLENQTHTESPWIDAMEEKKAGGSDLITHQAMRDFFCARQNRNVADATPPAPGNSRRERLARANRFVRERLPDFRPLLEKLAE